MTIQAKKETKTRTTGLKASKIKSQFPLFLMTLPGIILTFMFAYIPMFGVILAFKKINLRQGILGSPWIGLKNFSYLFKSNDLYIMVRNTLGYNIGFILIGTVLCVSMAVGLSIMRNKMTSKVFQTVLIMPHFLSMIIVSYLVLAFLNMEHGFLNKFLKTYFGIDPINWYIEPKYWPLILNIVNAWKENGFSSIIFISTIAGIDVQLYEAASIDGATGWQKVRHITLPMLRTIICIQLILSVGSILGGDFGLFYQVPMNSGALSDVTTTIPVYVYNNITAGGPRALGFASAVSFMQSVVGCILVITTNLIVKRIDSESSLF